jgi:hypothetical protein
MILDLAVHAHLAIAAARPALAGAIPNPPAVTPPGNLVTAVNTVIGWGKWIMFYLGIIGLLICGVQMLIGRRNRHSFAADGAAGIPWVLGGLSLVSASSGIVAVFLHP